MVRFNISQNDGRKSADGAIRDFGNLGQTDIYNNTVYLDPADFGRPAGIVLEIGTPAAIRVLNNIFHTAAGTPCLILTSIDGLDFHGNNYYSGGDALAIEWDSVTYDSVGAWSSTTGQQDLKAADSCRNIDPQLRAPGTGGTLGDALLLETLDAYRLTVASPLFAAGLDLEASGVDPGARDYYGTAFLRGRGSDIGAHAFGRKRSD